MRSIRGLVKSMAQWSRGPINLDEGNTSTTTKRGVCIGRTNYILPRKSENKKGSAQVVATSHEDGSIQRREEENEVQLAVHK